jgi:hypothetical protein
MNSRRTGWKKHAVCTGEIRNTYKILVRKPDRDSQLKKPTFSGKVNAVLNWILRKLTVRKWTGIG